MSISHYSTVFSAQVLRAKDKKMRSFGLFQQADNFCEAKHNKVHCPTLWEGNYFDWEIKSSGNFSKRFPDLNLSEMVPVVFLLVQYSPWSDRSGVEIILKIAAPSWIGLRPRASNTGVFV